MIKIDGPAIEIEGIGGELIPELAVAMRVLGYEKKLLSKEEMHSLVEDAYLSSEELYDSLMKELKKRAIGFDKLMEMLIRKHAEEKDTDSQSGSNASEKVFNDIFKDILGGDK